MRTPPVSERKRREAAAAGLCRAGHCELGRPTQTRTRRRTGPWPNDHRAARYLAKFKSGAEMMDCCGEYHECLQSCLELLKRWLMVRTEDIQPLLSDNGITSYPLVHQTVIRTPMVTTWTARTYGRRGLVF